MGLEKGLYGNTSKKIIELCHELLHNHNNNKNNYNKDNIKGIQQGIDKRVYLEELWWAQRVKAH